MVQQKFSNSVKKYQISFIAQFEKKKALYSNSLQIENMAMEVMIADVTTRRGGI